MNTVFFPSSCINFTSYQFQSPYFWQVCKLLRHIATTDSLQVAAKYGEINLKIYGPQVVTAAQTLCLYPTSKIAKENVEGEKLQQVMFIDRRIMMATQSLQQIPRTVSKVRQKVNIYWVGR